MISHIMCAVVCGYVCGYWRYLGGPRIEIIEEKFLEFNTLRGDFPYIAFSLNGILVP